MARSGFSTMCSHARTGSPSCWRLGLAEHLQQDAADVGVADPGRRVGVPGERGTARAAAGLVLRGVRADRRVVGLLGLPGDDPVLDVDLPRARPGAVHPVRRAHDLVVAPAVAVEVVGLAAADLRQRPQVLRDGPLGEEPAAPHQRVGERAVDPDVLAQRASCPSGGAADDGQGQHQGESRGDRQQPQADRVGVGAAVDVAHDQRRHEAAEAAGGADQAGHAADPAGVGDPGDQRERRAAAGAEGRGHRQERDVPTPSSGGVPAEIAAPTATTPYAAARTGIGAEPVGEPAADRPHDHGDHHEAGHPVGGVGRGQAVRGLEVGRQVDRERDVATEGDGVEDAGLPGDRQPGVGVEPAGQAGRRHHPPGASRRNTQATTA